MKNLAIHGGFKSLTSEPLRFNSYDHLEVQAATEVIQSGYLSGFLGSWSR